MSPKTRKTRRRFGQHFLEPVWAEKVLTAVAPDPGDAFLEIGPGTGALTLRLAERAAHVVAIEIDRDLIARLAPSLPANVSLVSGDVLDMDLAAVLATVAPASEPIRVAGNLPYNISSPILFRLLDLQSRRPCRDATLMLQREVAERIVAGPGSRDYGVLSILTQVRATTATLLTLPPGAFRPMPAVASALIRLTFHPPRIPARDFPIFERLVRSVFTQRRKTLGNALKPFADRSPLSAAEALRRAGIDPRRRPETLEMIDLAGLADIFASATV
jgi:16S rRNA (adenine1518-N6/adenine1519-N6)-dimethyltransferase